MNMPLTKMMHTYRSQHSIGMYPFTIYLILQVVRLDVCPKGLNNPRSAFFFNTKNVPYKVKKN